MSERIGMVRTIIGGLVFVMAGFAAMAFIGVDSGAAVVAVSFALIGGGSGLAQTVTNDAILAAAPADRAGAASAISETAYELGGAMGVALLGSLATGIYRAEIGDAPAAATETLGEAAHVAATLPAAAGDALLAAAQDRVHRRPADRGRHRRGTGPDRDRGGRPGPAYEVLGTLKSALSPCDSSYDALTGCCSVPGQSIAPPCGAGKGHGNELVFDRPQEVRGVHRPLSP